MIMSYCQVAPVRGYALTLAGTFLNNFGTLMVLELGKDSPPPQPLAHLRSRPPHANQYVFAR